MNLISLWSSLANTFDEHWLLARLFFGFVALAVLAVLAAILLRTFRPRTPRLTALVWTLILAKPLLTLAIGSPIHVLQLNAPTDLAVASPTEIAAESPGLPGGKLQSRVAAHHPSAKPGAKVTALESADSNAFDRDAAE